MTTREPARLITIALSHYCEKARWVLDHTGLAYREEPHAPVVHLRATRPLGGRTVPLLVHDGEVLRDSTTIAQHADALASPGRKLLPTSGDERARVLALEDELDETLGVDARLLVYWYTLHDDTSARLLVGRMMRLKSKLARSIVAPLFRALIFRHYGVSRDSARCAEDRVRDTFLRLDDTLTREPYLVAGRFTLADLTLASLASLLLLPREHPISGPPRGALPPGLVALRTELSATRTGQHALRVYREHRARAS